MYVYTCHVFRYSSVLTIVIKLCVMVVTRGVCSIYVLVNFVSPAAKEKQNKHCILMHIFVIKLVVMVVTGDGEVCIVCMYLSILFLLPVEENQNIDCIYFNANFRQPFVKCSS